MQFIGNTNIDTNCHICASFKILYSIPVLRYNHGCFMTIL